MSREVDCPQMTPTEDKKVGIPTPPPQDTWKPHPIFYYPLGGYRFLAYPDGKSATLYRFSADSVAQRSEFFSSTFLLPQSQNALDPTSEGMSDENPIILPGTLAAPVFDAFLTYIFLGPTTYERTREFLLHLIEACDFFDTPDRIDFAKREFEDSTRSLKERLDFPEQFYFARRFHIDDWIEPTFRRLLRMNWTRIRPEHVEFIGSDTLAWLFRTHGYIQELRRDITWTPPSFISGVDCETRARCEEGWNSTWSRLVLPFIHHPEQPGALRDLPEFLAQPNILRGVCADCRDATIAYCNRNGSFEQEQNYIERAVDAVKDLFVAKPKIVTAPEAMEQED
ncbi:hypothetical protein C8F01DRAFT_1373886 [Mycena amicta]|nr:hypothetical protein C8F01DRAFT_1373886 [Mycena amicta]